MTRTMVEFRCEDCGNTFTLAIPFEEACPRCDSRKIAARDEN